MGVATGPADPAAAGPTFLPKHPSSSNFSNAGNKFNKREKLFRGATAKNLAA